MEDETPPTTHRERKDLQARFVPNIQKMFEEAAAAKKSLFFTVFCRGTQVFLIPAKNFTLFVRADSQSV